MPDTEQPNHGVNVVNVILDKLLTTICLQQAQIVERNEKIESLENSLRQARRRHDNAVMYLYEAEVPELGGA